MKLTLRVYDEVVLLPRSGRAEGVYSAVGHPWHGLVLHAPHNTALKWKTSDFCYVQPRKSHYWSSKGKPLHNLPLVQFLLVQFSVPFFVLNIEVFQIKFS